MSASMQEPTEAQGRRLRPRILVLDDSEFCLEVTRLILKEAGYDVVTLDSPARLCDALSTEDPDLLLVDVGMPELSGDKLVELVLRELSVDRLRPVVLFSARPEEELRSLASSCGAAGFIKKGSSPAALVDAIRQLLPGRGSLPERDGGAGSLR
jgi:DNA-binding response OmpR family regulator